ncbi:MAG: SDR family NAD(P)-dependent oxidoreductase [Pseudomonadales bacterium]|nr:SDR family NAD(P)-dependent oxidoreductase [Pseudomonadales bacterium]
MKDFSGRVAAITGAGSGMGRALAILLAREGCHVAIADVSEDGLHQTMSQLPDSVTATSHVVDVSDRAVVETFAADVERAHGAVHMIFNNAGVSVTDTAEHMRLEDFEWLMNINFWGVVHGTRAFLPYLEKVDDAHIVNTSSIFGTIAVPLQSAYNASKFAVRGYTFSLRTELRGSHIGVSCVQPGGVKTNIVRSSRYVATDNEAPTREEFIASFDRLARLTPEDAAARILKGVRKNKARILVGGDAHVAAWLERLFPTGYLALMARAAPARK